MLSDEGLDPRSSPGELLFRPSMVDGHPTQEVGPRLLRVDAADVVLLPLRSSVVPLVMPEVQVPPSVEVSHAGTTSDFHSIPLSRGISREGFVLPGGGVRKCLSTASGLCE